MLLQNSLGRLQNNATRRGKPSKCDIQNFPAGLNSKSKMGTDLLLQ